MLLVGGAGLTKRSETSQLTSIGQCIKSHRPKWLVEVTMCYPVEVTVLPGKTEIHPHLASWQVLMSSPGWIDLNIKHFCFIWLDTAKKCHSIQTYNNRPSHNITEQKNIYTLALCFLAQYVTRADTFYPFSASQLVSGLGFFPLCAQEQISRSV